MRSFRDLAARDERPPLDERHGFGGSPARAVRQDCRHLHVRDVTCVVERQDDGRLPRGAERRAPQMGSPLAACGKITVNARERSARNDRRPRRTAPRIRSSRRAVARGGTRPTCGRPSFVRGTGRGLRAEGGIGRPARLEIRWRSAALGVRRRGCVRQRRFGALRGGQLELSPAFCGAGSSAGGGGSRRGRRGPPRAVGRRARARECRPTPSARWIVCRRRAEVPRVRLTSPNEYGSPCA